MICRRSSWYLNVALAGVLTGLVYGLMALGLSVIFGVVRVVNFAHGEMMTLAMYLRSTLFARVRARSVVMLVPVAAVLFVLGYALQAGLINPFVTRPEHAQFMLLVAVAIIMVNVPADRLRARRAQRAGPTRSTFRARPLIVDATKAYAAAAALAGRAGAVRVLPLHAHRQGDPRLRRQLPRRAGRRPRRQAPLCAHLRARRGLRRRRRRDAGAAGRRHAAARARATRCSPSSS